MRRHLPLAAALLLFLPLLTPAQGSKSADEAAIRQVVQLYIDGWNNNAAESLRQSLHPKGKWFVPSYTRDLTEITQGRVVENVRSNLRKGVGVDKGDSRTVSVDVTNDVAVVKVEFERPHSYITRKEGDRSVQPPGVKQTDYLSLLRLADGWKIVGKVTTLERLPGAEATGFQYRNGSKEPPAPPERAGAAASEFLITRLKICYKYEARKREKAWWRLTPTEAGRHRADRNRRPRVCRPVTSEGRTPRNLRVAKSQAPRGVSAPYISTYPHTSFLSKPV